MRFSLLVLIILLYNLSTAQTKVNNIDTTKQLLTQVIVTTGQAKPQSIKNAVHQIRVISQERIAKIAATNVETILANELNIRFNQDAATGGSDITMMGLKGQNVKILLDGLPLTGRQGVSNEININQIDINTIERIEIVEGPMAVIYGADALAGVINIITKKNNNAALAINLRLHEETIGKEYGLTQGIHNQSLNASWSKKNWEIGGSITRNLFSGWRDTAVLRELVWHKKDQILAGGYVAYQNKNLNVKYRIDGLDEIITNPANFSVFPNPISGDFIANDQQYLSKRVMQQLQSGYNFNNKLNFQLQSAYSNYSRQVYSTIVSKNTGKESIDMAAGKQAMIKFNSFTFRGILSYEINKKLTLQPGVDINLENGNGERLVAGNNAVNDYAFFVTADIKASNKISIKPGVRFIKNSVYDAPPVVSSLNTKIILFENLDWRFSYANGFRSPSIRELYFNFFDANHQIIGNPNLLAETSNSFNTSLNYNKLLKNNTQINSAVSFFYNNIKNMIDYALDPRDVNIFILTNVNNSKNAGVTFSQNIIIKNLQVNIGGAYTGFYNDLYGTDKSLPELQWSPEINGSIGYTFSKIGLNANLFYKLNGKRPYYTFNSAQEIVQAKQDGFQLADFTVNKQFLKCLQLNAGVRNLFDVKRIGSNFSSGGIHSANSNRSIATGRGYFLGLSYNFKKNK
jgi:outer membrane receptor for ferrienterochelin and colicins